MIIVSKDGSGDFSTVQAAVDAVPDGAGEEERRILIPKVGGSSPSAPVKG